MSDRALRIGLPLLVLAATVLIWDLVVRVFAIPPFVLPAPGLVLATLVADGGLLWNSLLVTLLTTFEGFVLAAVGGVGLAILFNQSRLVEYSFYPLRRHSTGDADCCHRAAAAHLSATAFGGAGLRLDRRVLPGARQHNAGPELDRPQSPCAVRLVQGLALAGAVEPEIAFGAAADACRIAHRGRPVADRRGRCGNCRRLGWRRLWTCLSHRRVRLPAQYPAHVRGAATVVDCRGGDLLCAVGDLVSGAAPLARECVRRER